MENLIEGLQRQMNRVREIIIVYESLPKNAGIWAATMMKQVIINAEDNISIGDTIGMMRSYTELEGFEL
jgi:hypothetical protein